MVIGTDIYVSALKLYAWSFCVSQHIFGYDQWNDEWKPAQSEKVIVHRLLFLYSTHLSVGQASYGQKYKFIEYLRNSYVLILANVIALHEVY